MLFLLRIRTTDTEMLDCEKIMVDSSNFVNCWLLTCIVAVVIVMIDPITYGLNLPNIVSMTWFTPSPGLDENRKMTV